MLCFVHANIFRVVLPVNPEKLGGIPEVKQISSVAGVLPKEEEVRYYFLRILGKFLSLIFDETFAY